MNDDRFEASAVTYADMALIRTSTGRIAAGVQLATRNRSDDGRVHYVPYATISGLYDVAAGSIRQSITVVAADIIRLAAVGTKLIVFRSSAASFQKRKAIEGEIELLAFDRGIHTKVHYDPRLYFAIRSIQWLANEAIKRGTTEITIL